MECRRRPNVVTAGLNGNQSTACGPFADIQRRVRLQFACVSKSLACDGKPMDRPFFSCLLVHLVIFLPSISSLAADVARDNKTRDAVKPVIADIEAVLLGKKHRPLKDFVASDAIFEEVDSPLIAHLEGAVSRRPELGERSFPDQSKLYWTTLKESSLLSMFKRYPRLDPGESVLVFRDLGRHNGRMKASGYVLQRFKGEWMVVFAFDGSGPEAQLSKNAIPFDDSP